jgi:hypothetical protein
MKKINIIFYLSILLLSSCKTVQEKTQKIDIKEYVEAKVFDIENFENNLKANEVRKKKGLKELIYYKKDNGCVVDENSEGEGEYKIYRSDIYIPYEFLYIAKEFDKDGNLKSIKNYYNNTFGVKKEIKDWCHFKDFKAFEYVKNSEKCKNTLNVKQVVELACVAVGVNFDNLVNSCVTNGKFTPIYFDKSTSITLGEFTYYERQRIWLVVLVRDTVPELEYSAVVLSEDSGKVIDVIKANDLYGVFRAKYLK